MFSNHDRVIYRERCHYEDNNKLLRDVSTGTIIKIDKTIFGDKDNELNWGIYVEWDNVFAHDEDDEWDFDDTPDFDEKLRWWVSVRSVELLDEFTFAAFKKHPNFNVIRKLDRLTTKRKENGYAF